MSDAFETSIPLFQTIEDTLSPEAYVELPPDWIIVVADVIQSTQAIQEGRYRDINAVGGSTIAAVLNAVKPRAIPFVFGGDGATFCVPPSSVNAVKKALKGCQELAEEGLNLQLRVGLVPYSKLSNPVRICRFKRASNLTQFFFIGNGLEEADDKTKRDSGYQLDPSIESDADFSGFECRWNLVPSAKEVTFSLLVKSRFDDQRNALQLFRRVV